MKVELTDKELFIIRQGLLALVDDANHSARTIADADVSAAIRNYTESLRDLINKLTD